MSGGGFCFCLRREEIEAALEFSLTCQQCVFLEFFLEHLLLVVQLCSQVLSPQSTDMMLNKWLLIRNSTSCLSERRLLPASSDGVSGCGPARHVTCSNRRLTQDALNYNHRSSKNILFHSICTDHRASRKSKAISRRGEAGIRQEC